MLNWNFSWLAVHFALALIDPEQMSRLAGYILAEPPNFPSLERSIIGLNNQMAAMLVGLILWEYSFGYWKMFYCFNNHEWLAVTCMKTHIDYLTNGLWNSKIKMRNLNIWFSDIFCRFLQLVTLQNVIHDTLSSSWVTEIWILSLMRWPDFLKDIKTTL